MKLISFLLTLLTITGLQAQTKLIAHKSHSGSSSTFSNALFIDAFNARNSNLGAAPERFITRARLDTLVFIDDTTSVMITSLVCDYFYEDNSTVWKPGRDTVYNHPVFTQKNSPDFIRQVLRKQYHFRSDADSTKFIGYENPNYPDENKHLLPVFNMPERPGPKLPVYLLSLILFVGLMSTILLVTLNRKQHRNLSIN